MKSNTNISIDTTFLNSYLKSKNININQFAEIIGVSNSTINRILNGKRNPGSKFIAGVLTNFSDLKFEQVFIFIDVLPKGNKKDTA